jgi:hypothetical protein
VQKNPELETRVRSNRLEPLTVVGSTGLDSFVKSRVSVSIEYAVNAIEVFMFLVKSSDGISVNRDWGGIALVSCDLNTGGSEAKRLAHFSEIVWLCLAPFANDQNTSEFLYTSRGSP